MRREISLTACVLVLAAAALGGCGGSKGGDQKSKVEAVLVEDYSANDPSKCDRIYTPKYLKSNWAGDPKRCAKEVPSAFDVADPPKKSDLKISEVKVSGSKASARVDNKTGGSGVRYTLVSDGGQWKIDGVEVP
ncbi:MAG: hypothetical protein QOJ07_2290 [Thermoleophilaceae bacterium]|nr:hypothetical protein [Thermoleophilaceae bacterium]